MTQYIEAFSWTKNIDAFLREVVSEKPLLNVCSGKTEEWGWGTVTLDKYVPADVRGDWCALPFKTGSRGAVFADPPWDATYKVLVSKFVREALRVAPVAYLMAPWTYGASDVDLPHIWFRRHPGVNASISLSKYTRGKGFEPSAEPYRPKVTLGAFA